MQTRTLSDKYRKYAKGPFITGCENLRHDALTGHQSSVGHSVPGQSHIGNDQELFE